MALCSSKLENKDISQVTKIVSAPNRFRFAVGYLEINPNEYKTIESEAQFIHHDTVFECIRRWKNNTEAEGKNAKDELIKILTQIREEHGWFPHNDMAFLTDVTGITIPESSKGLSNFFIILMNDPLLVVHEVVYDPTHLTRFQILPILLMHGHWSPVG